MKVQKFICIVAASLSLSWVQGQRLRDPSLEKPLPRVVEWTDNHHYVLQEQGEHPGKSQTYLVDVRNGNKERCKTLVDTYTRERRNFSGIS